MTCGVNTCVFLVWKQGTNEELVAGFLWESVLVGIFAYWNERTWFFCNVVCASFIKWSYFTLNLDIGHGFGCTLDMFY